ncbi:MAG: hypothetical protein PHF37_00520 [Phycisphaerae bacterium]|nr:hypothetical protein [Phycisphaerae bacterium]
MAGEICVSYFTGLNLYAIRRLGNLVLNPDSGVFEIWGTGGRTAADYAIALSPGQDDYTADFASDVTVPSGKYIVQIYERLGASPADNDPLVGSGEIVWNGWSEHQEIGDKIFIQGG